MKKLLLSIILATAVGLSASAQTHHEINFLAPVTSLVISNAIGYTNLASAAILGAPLTNIVGTVYTNLLGNLVTVGVADATALTVDVPLWSDRGGYPILQTSGSNTVFTGAISGYSVDIHISNGGSGANSAVNFVFVPVCDGVHESTAAGDTWTVGVTANTTSQVNLVTNVPIWKWPGCKTLRLRTITNADTDASSQVCVDSVTLNGFVP